MWPTKQLRGAFIRSSLPRTGTLGQASHVAMGGAGAGSGAVAKVNGRHPNQGAPCGRPGALGLDGFRPTKLANVPTVAGSDLFLVF